MKLTFFGVRGSLPSPGEKTMKYGGNTTSLLIEFEDENFIIIDSGTGIKNLGNYLLKRYKNKEYNIFFTHTHWDHIMGFPFFSPIYIPNTKIKFWGPQAIKGLNLKELVTNQLDYKYFPINIADIKAEITYQPLKEENFTIFDCKVKTIFLNHPILTLGYQFTYLSKSITTIFDHEKYYNIFNYSKDTNLSQEDISKSIKKSNKRIEDFIKDTDILIIDSQYTKKEYTNKKGWGHGYYEEAIKIAMNNNIKHLILFHHDPNRTDRQLDYILNWSKKILKKNGCDMKISIAKENMSITI